MGVGLSPRLTSAAAGGSRGEQVVDDADERRCAESEEHRPGGTQSISGLARSGELNRASARAELREAELQRVRERRPALGRLVVAADRGPEVGTQLCAHRLGGRHRDPVAGHVRREPVEEPIERSDVACRPADVSLMDALSGPWFWGPLAVLAAATLVVVLWRRRLEAARERAWVGSFSFADVVERRRTEDALQRAESGA